MNINMEILRNFTARTLKSWSGYQLALDNSCGGDETREKDKWFLDVLCEQMTTSRGLKAEDLEEWLTNILYHDFDLILEDDSSYQIAFFLLEGFGYIKNQNEAGLQQLLSKLPSDEELAQAKRESVRGAENDEDDEDMEIPEEEEEEEQGPSEPREPQRQVVVDEDGWTTITKRQ
ncbi:Protein CBG13670 [Caenorhabditis briggsae]|uniref:Pre-rRNA-processing protein TSR2 homolog n=1 Tax=Caenorhabditis briggsae TaxID=6238 RepID=A8XIG1_CAEBR|nr:Protein CBG13670 [Caenorhabditis briggsae]CAP32435.1 Protein CBG13670 [Caenorhabditis briggsae]